LLIKNQKPRLSVPFGYKKDIQKEQILGQMPRESSKKTLLTMKSSAYINVFIYVMIILNTLPLNL